MNNKQQLISFDWAIKYLLKDKAGHKVIEGFLNALLCVHNDKQERIKIVAKLDSESHKESEEKKKSLADLLVEDESGHKYIVEIERSVDKTIMHKAVFNTSRTVVDNVPTSESKLGYFEVKKVYHITLAYFEFGNGNLYHGKTIVKDIETEKPLEYVVHNHDEVIEAHNVFPEYYFISIPNFDDNVKDAVDEWLYIMKNQRIEKNFKAEGIREAAKRLDYLKLSEDERLEYDIYRKDISSIEYKMETSYEKGKVEEREKADKEKFEEKLEIARKFKSMGLSNQQIIDGTGLPKSDIDKL